MLTDLIAFGDEGSDRPAEYPSTEWRSWVCVGQTKPSAALPSGVASVDDEGADEEPAADDDEAEDDAEDLALPAEKLACNERPYELDTMPHEEN